MPSDVTRSTEALQRALDAWSPYTKTYERYALLHESLAGSGSEVMNYFLGSLERYIQDERMRMLGTYWGTSSATPKQAEEITVPPYIMVRINGVVNFYGINRVFLFLYVHAYLWSKVMKTGPLEMLDYLVDELDPR